MIAVTAQIDGQAESTPSNARAVTVPAPVVVPPPPPITTPPATPGTFVDITPNVPHSFQPLKNYGMQALDGAKADKPLRLYVGTCGYGIERSDDGGNSWKLISTGRNGSKLGNNPLTDPVGGSARNWSLVVDPTNSDIVYAIAGFGQGIGGGGIWKSINGGVDWDQIVGPEALAAATDDFTNIAIDPLNHLHLLAASHSPWPSAKGTAFEGMSSLIECFDGGASGKWILHPPQNWGVAPTVQFLGQDDTGAPSSSYWLVCSGQNAKPNAVVPAAPITGTFRTPDSGASWAVVFPQARSHAGGGTTLYRMASAADGSTKGGALLLGLDNRIVISLDNGRSWKDDNAPGGPDGFGALMGDGKHVFAMLGNTGDGTEPAGTGYHWIVRPETVAGTWSIYNAQTFRDGPMSMIYDPIGKIFYSSNWSAGCLRLQQ